MKNISKTTTFFLLLLVPSLAISVVDLNCVKKHTNCPSWKIKPDTIISNKNLDIIFANSFEGPAIFGSSISGKVLVDPNSDGNLTDGVGLGDVTVYLDTNYNAQLDNGEYSRTTASDGSYEFTALVPAVYHVRQQLIAPNIQTVPAAGATPVFDMLPDSVFNYTHSDAGVGQLDQPYGKLASEWPGDWSAPHTGGGLPEVVDVNIVLKSLGVRNTGTGVKNAHEALSLPIDASITVQFDEIIIDGPGPDLIIHTLTSGTSTEIAEIFVGPTPSDMQSVGNYQENLKTILIDLQDFNITKPIQYVKVVGQDNGGTWWGFELTGFEAINIAAPDPNAHIVVISQQNPVYTNLDFGRYSQDLLPTITIGFTDNDLSTPELRAGESITVLINAFDDVAISNVELLVDGQTVNLDANYQAVVNLTNPGEIQLQATATDSAGQTASVSTQYYIYNADGTQPYDPSLIGQSTSNNINAPKIRILSPSAGSSLSGDVEILASISSVPEPTSWAIEYAQVDLIDPYDLAAADSDYIQIASGTGNVFSSPIGILPLSTLADDIYFVRISASNSINQTAYFGQVIAKNIAESDLRPVVVIDGPVSGSEVSMTTDISGSINSTRPLIEWYAEYALANTVDLNNIGSDAPDWKRIASGTATIPSSEIIANFDSTLLKNDSYVVRIVAKNNIGMGWVEPLILEVVGEAKLGRNRLEFSDISIDLAGFPLKFVRVYDSLNANENGELGYGWSLQLQNTDVSETVPDTGVAGIFGSTPFRYGTRVYITAPSGERLAFTFEPVAGTPSGLGTPYRVVFRPDPGNYYKLEVPEGDSEFISLQADGNVYLFPIGFPYNPERYILIASDGKRYTIHQRKGLLKAEDLAGNSLTFNPNSISHSSGPKLQMTRDSQGRITSITDPEGNSWLYDYDSAGDLVAFTDPDMNTSIYSYLTSPAHYLDVIEDPQGRMPKRFEYDPATGRQIAEIDENGNRRETNIDPQGFVGTATDARGNVSYFEYDARGNTTLIEDPYGNQRIFEFNDPANPDLETRLTDSTGQQWNYQYNAMGLPTRLSPPMAFAGSNRYSIEYDALGNMTRFNDLNQRESTYTYDAQGNPTSYKPNAGVLSNFVYGANGQIQRKDTANAGYSITYGYDSNGFLGSINDPTGYMLQQTNLENGRMAQRSDNNGSLDIVFTPAGKLNTQTDPDGNMVSLVENADGSLTRTDRLGNTLQLSTDANQRPVSIILPNGGQLTTSYDPDGNPKTITDPLNNTFTYNFDNNNQSTGFTDHLSNSETFTRNSNRDISEITDRNGKKRMFLRDNNRRITSERWLDGVGNIIRDISYTYDGNFGLRQVDDTHNGQTYTLKYTGRLPQVSSVDYVLPGQAAWKIRYDWNKEITTPKRIRLGVGVSTDARITVTPYAGKTYKLQWKHPGTSGDGNELQFYRNPDSSIQRLQRLTGVDGSNAISKTEFTYDNQSRISSIIHTDDLGNLLHANANLTYTRDVEGRLLTESHTNNTISYTHDGSNQIISASHSNPVYTDESYTYDLAGNRQTSHLSATTATIIAPNRITTTGDFSYEYDLAGNLSRKTNAVTGEVHEFSYDHRNRLILATTHPSLGAPATNTLEFEYDYLDRILFQVVNGNKTWFLHDRKHRIAEFADTATQLSASYLYDPATENDVHAIWRDGAVGELWFLKDQLGSVRGITDESFNILSWVDYDAYGNLQTGSMPALNEQLRFAARPFISELGLYDNRRRFYDPMLGRFTQEDPIKHDGKDFNFYRYVENNPTGLVDPNGTSLSSFVVIVELIFFAKDVKDGADVGGALGTPCTIASMSAGNLGYLVPVANILRNPSIASSMPEIEPVDVLPPVCKSF